MAMAFKQTVNETNIDKLSMHSKTAKKKLLENKSVEFNALIKLYYQERLDQRIPTDTELAKLFDTKTQPSKAALYGALDIAQSTLNTATMEINQKLEDIGLTWVQRKDLSEKSKSYNKHINDINKLKAMLTVIMKNNKLKSVVQLLNKIFKEEYATYTMALHWHRHGYYLEANATVTTTKQTPKVTVPHFTPNRVPRIDHNNNNNNNKFDKNKSKVKFYANPRNDPIGPPMTDKCWFYNYFKNGCTFGPTHKLKHVCCEPGCGASHPAMHHK